MTDIQKQFENDLKEAIRAVCRKYRASITLTDDGRCYGMHSPILDIGIHSTEYQNRINFTMYGLDINEEYPTTP